MNAPQGFDHHRGREPLLPPTSPLRTGLFVALSLTGFIAVNALWHYLGSGRWIDLSPVAFRRDLASPLGQTFVQPLSVFSYPWMILVNGLLLGVIIFTPVTLAVLYRLRVAAGFVAVVVLVGHAPVLAAALAGGCLLAGKTHLRSDKPFLAALLGLVPIAVYLCFFGFLGTDSPVSTGLQRVALHAPLVVAFVSAILAVAIVLLLARLTRYRPGIVWPVLTVMLAIPLAIFHRQVGTAELEYSLIVSQLPGGTGLLEPIALETWRRDHQAQSMIGAKLHTCLLEDLGHHRQGLVSRCEQFAARHHSSPRLPEILWLEAQAASLVLDEQALELSSSERGLVRYSTAHSQEVSAPLWRVLVDKYDSSPQAALAHWRLVELALRNQDVASALNHLQQAQRRLSQQVLEARSQQRPLMEVFVAPATIPNERYYDEALLATQRLLWLIQRNDVVYDVGAAEALAALMRLNPCRIDYYQRLCHLAGLYESTPLEDNLKLAVAMATPNLYERAEMLIPLADNREADSSIEANYELGRLALQTVEAPALSLVPRLAKPHDYFSRVVDAAPNPFADLAAQHLVWLSTTQTGLARAADKAP